MKARPYDLREQKQQRAQRMLRIHRNDDSQHGSHDQCSNESLGEDSLGVLLPLGVEDLVQGALADDVQPLALHHHLNDALTHLFPRVNRNVNSVQIKSRAGHGPILPLLLHQLLEEMVEHLARSPCCAKGERSVSFHILSVPHLFIDPLLHHQLLDMVKHVSAPLARIVVMTLERRGLEDVGVDILLRPVDAVEDKKVQEVSVVASEDVKFGSTLHEVVERVLLIRARCKRQRILSEVAATIGLSRV
mmetsp:Transcript_34714/g.108689  ORF Transcript_34714/g.108689 Transcript_34714/m.108689 type:complete len:247 (-) Transcript_34714:1048-1788(-)